MVVCLARFHVDHVDHKINDNCGTLSHVMYKDSLAWPDQLKKKGLVWPVQRNG